MDAMGIGINHYQLLYIFTIEMAGIRAGYFYDK